MPSILRRQFSNLSDDEALQRFSYAKASLWELLSVAYGFDEQVNELDIVETLNTINYNRRKISWIIVLLSERGLTVEDDGILDSAKQALIDVAKKFKICPFEFGETFESLGIKDPWVFKSEISVVDFDFQQRKDHLKKVGIMYIKENPSCNQEDLNSYLDANFSEEDAALGKFLMVEYRKWAVKRELITEDTFEAFRGFIVQTPIEVLEAL